MDKISKNRIKKLGQLEENVDEAMRVEVFRLYSVGESRRNMTNLTNHKQTGMSNKKNNPYYSNQ